MDILKKILNGKTLLGINIALVLATQLVGGGRWFHDSGAVHIVAILFIVLAMTRLFSPYKVSDPFIGKFVRASIVALIFFAASHVVEFVTIVMLDLPPEAVHVSVLSVYIASVLFFLLGVQYVLRMTGRQSSPYSWTLLVLVSAIITAIVYVAVNPSSIYHSATAPGVLLALYGIALLLVIVFQVIGFRKVQRILPVLKGMQSHLLMASAFIVLSVFPTIYHQLWGHSSGIPGYQIVYFSHYGFYAAASSLYLAFGALDKVGGVYETDSAAPSSVEPS
jgi:hypothetical protein